jgi:hypothetical protein
VFTQKDKEIQRINADPKNTFTVAHNQFSTWTNEEYKRMLGVSGRPNLTKEAKKLGGPTTTGMDWRQRGAVNDVKNQA